MPFSSRERAAETRQKPTDLVREAVGCNGGLGHVAITFRCSSSRYIPQYLTAQTGGSAVHHSLRHDSRPTFGGLVAQYESARTHIGDSMHRVATTPVFHSASIFAHHAYDHTRPDQTDGCQ